LVAVIEIWRVAELLVVAVSSVTWKLTVRVAVLGLWLELV